MESKGFVTIRRTVEYGNIYGPVKVTTTLLHTDLHAGQYSGAFSRHGDGGGLSWPCMGAGVDLVFLTAVLARHGGDPEPILGSHALTRDVDPDAVSAVVCVAGVLDP
ncbi:hypothetical protein [Nocardia nova]|uniref:hypothetical protein n=1 Tax=Nocardia nova TaxID=37330 RepID=UPI0007A557A7|nr:hypothetical protein [Nocardia nova]